MKLNLPFSKTGMMLNLEEELDYEILESAIASMPKSGKSEDELVLEAMAHPNRGRGSSEGRRYHYHGIPLWRWSWGRGFLSGIERM